MNILLVIICYFVCGIGVIKILDWITPIPSDETNQMVLCFVVFWPLVLGFFIAVGFFGKIVDFISKVANYCVRGTK